MRGCRSLFLIACLVGWGCTPSPSGNNDDDEEDTGGPGDAGADMDPADTGGSDAGDPDLGRVDVGPDCEPTAELCNGEDDDCDGVVDNGFEGLGMACTAGEGACGADGVMVCTADGMGIECDAVPGEPGAEACNGLDDDCNGTVDDGFDVGQPCADGDGACRVEGITICAPDGASTICDAEALPPADELCNGLDDDCDGALDEETGGDPCETGEPGLCNAGVEVCAEGALSCVQAAEPAAEVCDGLDNDCDGEVDDVDGAGEACTAGVGPCARDGVQVCGPDGLVCDAVPGEPEDEVCDGIDNDCNGVVDDAPGTGRACGVGIGECAADGRTVCTPMGPACDAVPGEPQPELCDGLDNDCDGEIDDVDGLGAPCSAGVGACEVQGVVVCTDEGPQCDAAPAPPLPEACDGIDNDCNGVVDDPPVCGAPEVCDNGVDDDLDEQTDCADPDCDGHPACGPPPVRGVVLLCGASSRDMSVLIEPADGVAFAAGCAPDGDTQAMLVSRNGINQIDDAAWTAYLRAGGRIITEYSATDEVFNAVFDANVAAGQQSGGCFDNVNPAFRLNEDDPFWRANAAVPVNPPGETGCGLDVSAYPEIVPLGGHTDGAVHLAYRDLGDGRLYLVEGDWQDIDGGAGDPTYFNEASRTLMRSMIFGSVGLRQIGSFQVTDGPRWSDAGVVSYACVEACALLFGGDPAEYGCSTVDGVYNGRAFADGWGDSQFCRGEGVAEDFVMPEGGGAYDCGAAGCSYSAYVNDHSAECAVTNYCWRGAAPAPAPRTVLMRCGQSDRDVATFIPAGVDLRVVEGCAPDADTQALLITRNGAGQFDGAAVRAYLEDGGVVITEYDVSDDVYGAVTGVAVARGVPQGNCSDQVNPPVRFNEADAFWVANGGLPLGGPNTGCGFDVGDFPGVTPLGGWDANTVSLAYIDVGDGRLWLVDIDWQDADEGFQAASLQLMQYMVMNGAVGGPVVLPEVCDDGLDNDRDGVTDCADPDCEADPACVVVEGGLVAGVQQNVPAAVLAARGWQECFRGTYGTDGESIDALLAACAGSQMLIGCRPVGQADLTLAAEGLTAEVTRNIGRGQNAVNPHNGVDFYYDPTYSWGFAPQGAGVNRSSCDTAGAQAELRMCWHAGPGNVLESGYRCGNAFLNGDNSWERLVYVRDIVPLARNQAYGHHGNCETFNACGDAQTCADLACATEGFGPAASWAEGRCSDIAAGPVPDLVCNLFNNPEPGDLDLGWGPSGGCNIPVAWDISCLTRGEPR